MAATKPVSLRPTDRDPLRYDLDSNEIDRATAELFDRFASSISAAKLAGHRRMCISVTSFDNASALARTVEQIGLERLADNLPPSAMQAEYSAYEDRSLFFLGIDLKKEKVCASMRIITGETGAGPMVKTMSDTISHSNYPELHDHSSIIDLRDQHDIIDLRSRDCETSENSSDETNPSGRQFVEDFHGMEPGKAIFDIATVSSIGRSSDAAAWTIMLVAAALRASRIVQADDAVTFVTTEMLGTLQRSLEAPWIDLADRPAVQYMENDSFLSQPAYADFGQYWVELQTAFDLLAVGESSGKGSFFDRVAKLAISSEKSCQFDLQNI